MRLPKLLKLKQTATALSFLENLIVHPWIEPIVDVWYDFTAFVEWVRRAWDYAKLGYKNWDFDALTIERYLLFKLKRVEKCLINGTCDLTVENGPRKMKAIKLCIKLLERLNDHYHRFTDMHDAKWGEMENWFEPCENGLGSYWRTRRPKANTPELIEQEKREFREAYMADDREEQRDRKLVYRIIEKYIQAWWD